MGDYSPHWFKSGHSSLEHECLEVAVIDPVWRKSSYSNFAMNCAEVAARAEPEWFKSSHSSMENGDCIEVASGPVTIMLRDSQNREAAVLAVPAWEWAGTVFLVSGRGG
ncbi:DUF397 domain-containing protein [Nocardiopsis exhalans]|uniref:DUF397 domain-containing protein n=1 Tax=Nocardiopsis exhalans TaxID=163604 RepID=A0ABY5D757_9ACTN|nr:DUF397 domain-containing protein [Nocardiopsis exhalans]USY19104.1 DUF397 domain-containing protein [Nocardiopsis exhalans]